MSSLVISNSIHCCYNIERFRSYVRDGILRLISVILRKWTSVELLKSGRYCFCRIFAIFLHHWDIKAFFINQLDYSWNMFISKGLECFGAVFDFLNSPVFFCSSLVVVYSFYVVLGISFFNWALLILSIVGAAAARILVG